MNDRARIVVYGQEHPVKGIWGDVDYLRLTTSRDMVVTPQRATRNELTAIEVAKLARSGSACVRTALLGYVGVGVDGIFGGSSPQGLMLQASGFAAPSLTELAPSDMRPSRIDLQATYECEDPDGLIAEIAMMGLALKADRHSYWGKVSLRHVVTYGKGDTLYLGQRTSPRFIRIYNKSAQDPDNYPNQTIRFEVEYKDDLARRCFFEIRKALNRPTAAYSMMVSEMARAAVILPKIVGQLDLGTPKREGLDKTDEDRLEWLRNQVRPTVVGLLDRGVSRETLERILGLAEAQQERFM